MVIAYVEIIHSFESHYQPFIFSTQLLTMSCVTGNEGNIDSIASFLILAELLHFLRVFAAVHAIELCSRTNLNQNLRIKSNKSV